MVQELRNSIIPVRRVSLGFAELLSRFSKKLRIYAERVFKSEAFDGKHLTDFCQKLFDSPAGAFEGDRDLITEHRVSDERAALALHVLDTKLRLDRRLARRENLKCSDVVGVDDAGVGADRIFTGALHASV